MSLTEKNATPLGHLYQAKMAPEPSSADDVHQAEGNKSIFAIMTNILSRIKTMKLEFVAFIYTFSFVMTKISSTTMIIDKICLVHFAYSEDICRNLSGYEDIKESVEKLATNYQLGHTLIQTVPAAVLACFIGPWSDHYGRKLPTMIALTGMILDALGSSFCAYFLKTRVEYYYIPAIFTGMLGGSVTILAVVYSYASDSTPLAKRTMKYAFIEMASGFAIPLGATAGGWTYRFLGYEAVFLLSACGLIVSLMWVMFVLDETRGIGNTDSWSVRINELFSCESFKGSFKATVKKRPHGGRLQVVLLIMSACFIVVTIQSTGDINFLYVHHQFSWGNTMYSTITAVYAVIGMFLLFAIVPLMRYFKITDPTLGLIGITSLLVKNIGVGLAWKPGVYHLASLCGLLSACAPLAVRSRISKVVSNEDLAKVFSFVATSESLFPMLMSVVMSQIFKSCLHSFPGMPYITLALFLILPLVVFIWMIRLKVPSYERMQQNSEDDLESKKTNTGNLESKKTNKGNLESSVATWHM